MPVLNLVNTPAGPTITVVLGPSLALQRALAAAGQTIPSSVIGTFLVDTGASHSMVDASLIGPLNLKPSGAVMVHTPSTAGAAVSMALYDMCLYMADPGGNAANGWLIDSIALSCSSFAGQTIHGLIGRDIIDQGVLIYNGPAKQFTLAY